MDIKPCNLLVFTRRLLPIQTGSEPISTLYRPGASTSFSVIVIILSILSVACHTSPTFTKKDIAGAWKVDSIISYTNGFIERKAAPDTDANIVFDYDSTGQLTMKKEHEQRRIQYEILAGDSLIYRSAKGTFIVGYRILALSPDKLVLKKKQRPMFPGKNQEVYEIRQFSPALAK